MSNLLELHKEKNIFLERFSQLNADELSNFANGNFDKIEAFYNQREKILEILQFIEDKISLQSHLATTKVWSGTERKMLENAILEIKILTHTIVQQDMDILSLVDATKSAIIRELQSLKKNKKSVSGYKTKVDHHQIDEEA